jgi:hypothetical protein
MKWEFSPDINSELQCSFWRVVLAQAVTICSGPRAARATLTEIYNWFTEGFDTADLKDAKALLDELVVQVLRWCTILVTAP